VNDPGRSLKLPRTWTGGDQQGSKNARICRRAVIDQEAKSERIFLTETGMNLPPHCSNRGCGQALVG